MTVRAEHNLWLSNFPKLQGLRRYAWVFEDRTRLLNHRDSEIDEVME